MPKPAILLFDCQPPKDVQIRLVEDAGLLLSGDIGTKLKLSTLLRFARRYVETYASTGWVSCIDDVMRLIVEDSSVRGEAMLFVTGRLKFLIFRGPRTIMHATLGKVTETWLIRWDGTCGRLIETRDGDRFIEWGGERSK